jgi:hypothetical protein
LTRAGGLSWPCLADPDNHRRGTDH